MKKLLKAILFLMLTGAAASARAQGLGPGQLAFNQWDQGAFTAQFFFSMLNPPTTTTDTVLVLVESNNGNAPIVNGYHGQATATNTFGMIGLLSGGGGEADVWSSGTGGVGKAFGTWGIGEVHTGVALEVDGGFFQARVDAGAVAPQANGNHIVTNVINGKVTENNGLLIDDQFGGDNNYAIHTGRGLVTFGDFASLSAQKLVLLGSDATCGWNGSLGECITPTPVPGLTRLLPKSTTINFSCDLAVAAASKVPIQIDVQMSGNPAGNLEASGVAYTGAVPATGVVAGVSSTDPQAVVTFVPPTPGTKLPVHLSGTIEGTSELGTTFSLQIVTVPTDLVVVYRGSACWLYF